MDLGRIARSRTLWKVLALLLLLEGGAASGWLVFFFDAALGHLVFGISLLAVQSIALVSFLCGGRVEQQRTWFTRFARIRESRRSYYEPFRVSGDPTLAKRVNALRPARAFVTLTSREQMLEWRRSIRHQIMHSLYDDAFAPDQTLPRIHLMREVSVGARLSRALVTFEAGDGTTIPAYLFRPEIAQRLPAVLVIPGHGRGIVETAGLVPSYQHGAALALARAGFITLTPELRGFGHLGERLGTDHIRVAMRALQVGIFYRSILLHDLRRALTALLNQPEVDPERVAVTGCSLGGDLSVTLGALDTRVRAVVAQGLRNWRGERGQRPTPEEDGSAFTRHACTIIPGEASVAHYEDRFLLLPPRPFAIVNGRRSVGDMREDQSWLLSLLRAAYRLEQADDRLEFVLAPGGHEYHLAPAISFLRHHLTPTAESLK